MSWVSGVIWSLVSRVIWSPDPIILTSCNSSVTTQSFTFELTPDWSIIAVSCSWLADDTPLLHTRTQLWLYWLVFYPQLITISPFVNTMEMVFIFCIIVSTYSSHSWFYKQFINHWMLEEMVAILWVKLRSDVPGGQKHPDCWNFLSFTLHIAYS